MGYAILSGCENGLEDYQQIYLGCCEENSTTWYVNSMSAWYLLVSQVASLCETMFLRKLKL